MMAFRACLEEARLLIALAAPVLLAQISMVSMGCVSIVSMGWKLTNLGNIVK